MLFESRKNKELAAWNNTEILEEEYNTKEMQVNVCQTIQQTLIDVDIKFPKAWYVHNNKTNIIRLLINLSVVDKRKCHI